MRYVRQFVIIEVIKYFRYSKYLEKNLFANFLGMQLADGYRCNDKNRKFDIGTSSGQSILHIRFNLGPHTYKQTKLHF